MSERILFIGSDEFSVPTLQKLALSPGYELVGVVTQPDRPVGRKQVITPPPLKQFIQESGDEALQKLPIYQPAKLRKESSRILEEVKPDLIIVVAYGQMIPEDMINYPKHKCLNIHGSLLPKYRGAVPIEIALLNGDKTIGVSILQMTPGLDDGPVLAEFEMDVAEHDDSVTLRQKLSREGADLMISILPNWIGGSLEVRDQESIAVSEGRALSLCKVTDLSRENAEIKPTDSVVYASNKIRAFASGRGAWTQVDHNNARVALKVTKAEIFSDTRQLFGWGKFSSSEGKLLLGFPDGQLSLLQLQLAGKKTGGPSDYQFLANEKKEQVRALIRSGEDLLIIRRQKFGRKYVVLPGGHMLAGESKLETLVREIREESGILAEENRFQEVCTVPDGLNEIIHVYRLDLSAENRPELKMSGDELDRQNEDNTYELAWIRHDSEELDSLMPPDLLANLKL